MNGTGMRLYLVVEIAKLTAGLGGGVFLVLSGLI